MRIEIDAVEELTALLAKLACRQIESEQHIAQLQERIAALVEAVRVRDQAIEEGFTGAGALLTAHNARHIAQFEHHRTLLASQHEGLSRQSDRIGWLEDEALRLQAGDEALQQALRDLEARLIPPAAPARRPRRSVYALLRHAWRCVRYPKLVKREKDLRIVQHCGLFDADWYRATNMDVAQSDLDPAVHYVRHGAREGRSASPRFNTAAYRKQHALPRDVNPLTHHYRAARAKLQATPELFDTGFYLAGNPDVRSAALDPVDHFLSFGIFEGRRPSRQLSAKDVDERLRWSYPA